MSTFGVISVSQTCSFLSTLNCDYVPVQEVGIQLRAHQTSHYNTCYHDLLLLSMWLAFLPQNTFLTLLWHWWDVTTFC